MKPDYDPCASSVHNMLEVTTDFDLTGEVRFCDRPVPVKKVCSCEVTGHDLAILATMLHLDNPLNYFNLKDEISEGCKGEPHEWTENPDKCLEELNKLNDRILQSDFDLIKNILLMTPTPISSAYGTYKLAEGIDEHVALTKMEEFEKRCAPNPSESKTT
jgi:hypothetical protein